MLAVKLDRCRITVVERPEPPKRRGYARIRLLCGGICNTDIELRHGYYGYRGILGHEFVGEAMEGPLAGKRVVGEINLPCKKCDWCRRGLGRHCPKRKVLGIVKHPGAFREVIDLPEANLHAVPDSVSTDHAVFTEPLAAACEILDQVTFPRGEPVAVLGDGKLGLLIAQVLHLNGVTVHHYGRHREKLEISDSAGIATGLATDLPEADYNYVVEATGSAAGLRSALQMVRPRGMVIMKSTVKDTVPLDTAPVIVNEITLVGSRCGRFEPALELLSSGKLQLDRMISERFKLSDAPEAFFRAEKAGVIKVLLDA